MKAKKLVSLAIPVMLLVGCGTDKVDSKAKDKVESKAETKEKLSEDKYVEYMTSLESDLMGKIQDLVQVPVGNDKDDKTIKKEIAKQESELQTIIAKFDKIEPPKEYANSHKDLLKAVDYYSKAYSKQAKYYDASIRNIDPSKKKEVSELIENGNKYWVSGFQPVQDETDRLNSIKESNVIKEKLSGVDNTNSSSFKSKFVSNSEEVKKYKQDLIDNSLVMADAVNSLEKVAGTDINAYVQNKDEIQRNVDKAKESMNKLKDLKAPKGFEYEQDSIKLSMKYYEDAFQLLNEAMGEENKEKLFRSKGKTNMGATLFDDATKGIAEKSQE